MTGPSLPAVPGLRLGDRPETTAQGRLHRGTVKPARASRSPAATVAPGTIGRFASRLVEIRRAAAKAVRLPAGPARHDALESGRLVSTFGALLAGVREIYGHDLHDEQLFAAWSLVHGRLVEMQTGEGKTLTAGLAAVAVATTGTPVHVLTVNEYLAERDATTLAPLYERFGLSSTAILAAHSASERRQGYADAICHLAHRQVVFDWLRDHETHGDATGSLRNRLWRFYDSVREPPLLRGLCFAIVDEADSVLIDDALTPFVLAESAPRRADEAAEAAAALAIARTLHPVRDFEIDDTNGSASLTDDGASAVSDTARRLGGVWRHATYRDTRIEQALSALHHFERDRHYLIREGRVLLIDESTGRVAADRRLQHGLQEMIEVKEHCDTSAGTVAAAATTAQGFFPRYRGFCGLSGTLDGLGGELERVYGLQQVCVPPHRPVQRIERAPTIVRDVCVQFERLASVVAERQRRGQAVLIGTRSVRFSERVSEMLAKRGIDHDLLNARQDSTEAAIVARAGEPGAVTVATNMAGRGTDIPLSALVRGRGGLLVIAVEANPSARLDRQLFGRAGRQGDPGAAWHLLTLEDELFRTHLPAAVLALAVRLCDPERGVPAAFARVMLRVAQRGASRVDARIRRHIHDSRDQVSRRLAIAGEPDG